MTEAASPTFTPATEVTCGLNLTTNVPRQFLTGAMSSTPASHKGYPCSTGQTMEGTDS